MPLPSAADLDSALADLDAMNAEGRADPKLIECWLCSQRLLVCRRPDCPRAWKLKDAPPLDTEGRAGRHDVGRQK
jgi:hypothetical protein